MTVSEEEGHRQRGFLRHGLIYWMGRMGSRAISFLLLPIYTAYILPADWGILNLLMITADLAALSLSLQLPSALYRFWNLSHTEDERRRLSGLVLTVSIIATSAIFLPLYIWADRLAVVVGMAGFGAYLRILMASIQLAVIMSVIQAEIRLREESRLYAMLDMGQNLFTALLGIAVVAGLGWGIKGLLVAQLTTFAVFVGLLIRRLLRRTELNLNPHLLRRLLTFSLPLIPSSVAMAGIHNFDRYFLQALAGAETVGIYTMGYKFGFLINMLVLGPFLLIWEPKMYEIAQKPDAPANYGAIFSNFAALVLFVAVGVAGSAREIVHLLTSPAYWGAQEVVPVIVAAYVFFSLDHVVRVGLMVHSRTSTILAVVLLSCGINIGGNILLIPRIGMMGAALATLGAFAVLFLFDLFLARKYIAIGWEKRRLVILLLVSSVVLTALLIVPQLSLLPSILCKVFIVATYPILLALLGFFGRLDIKKWIVGIQGWRKAAAG